MYAYRIHGRPSFVVYHHLSSIAPSLLRRHPFSLLSLTHQVSDLSLFSVLEAHTHKKTPPSVAQITPFIQIT